MADAHMMTRRLVDYIQRTAERRTFASIAEDTGLDEKTIRLVFRETVSPARPLNLTWLGIDEIYLPKPYGVLSDIEHKCVVDLLPNRSKKTIIRTCLNFRPERKLSLSLLTCGNLMLTQFVWYCHSPRLS